MTENQRNETMLLDPVKPLLSLLSPSGRKGRLSVFLFHRVLASPDPLMADIPDVASFDAILGWIKGWFNVLPLDEAVIRLQASTLPARAAAITFDDGYADNGQFALPLLQKHGLNATLFVATGFLDGGIMWNDALIETLRQAPGPALDLEDLGLGRYRLETIADRRNAIDQLLPRLKYLEPAKRMEMVERCVEKAGASLPRTLMMSSEDLRQWRRAGMVVGGHTVHHPILARIPDAQAQREICDGKAQLEKILGEDVCLFAYPNGHPGEDYLPQHVHMVREAGFSGAVSTVWGAGDSRQDIYQLPRFTPWDRSRTKFGLRLVRNLLRSIRTCRR